MVFFDNGIAVIFQKVENIAGQSLLDEAIFAARIDDLALLVQHIVIFEEPLAD